MSTDSKDSRPPAQVEIGDEQDLKKKLQPLAPQPLADVVKMELLADKDRVELETIWTAYHEEKKSAVGTTLRAEEWETLSHRLEQNPMFVFPVKKGDGAFFVLLAEWKENTLLMTFLEDYQKNPALADPYFYLKAYPDFAEDRDLVLLRGEFLPYLTKSEANDLLDSALDFYLEPSKFEHVQTFNHRSHLFDFNKVFGI
ncbi:ATP synthase mitochondrial F1 complex assembly factor 1 [Hondaea fermentalgiana]|uniref:ATP synthase mitochondrial F1 complex assembly factor 1 n=1 Tax=Hondaea fermentalgiana TaxID=2315210 RepID=A0A2R5GX32_9STRA|nr:ATP synthase mitochondrial F1 complex assembly factor 1 [Hondaea fermentalgiana]|eukprot:GBG34338.1 ATP synthase mitochondrial F1 complex assembly factor 1 [Hondaea fermentalgiana]